MTIWRMHLGQATRSIAAVALALALGDLATPAALAAQGRVRQLGCRGGHALTLRVETDPNPRDKNHVVARVDYRPSTKAVGYDYRALDPGTCTWNPTRDAGYPAEPGYARLDLMRDAQPGAMKDTSIKAGAFFPDPTTLPRYLADSRHYYIFYVDDSSHFSVSFGPIHESAVPVFVMTSGPAPLDPATKREIRCRGGTGLMFGGGGTVGPNQASVTMSYRVSAAVPGNFGRGLTAGSCAWVDRTGVPKEPGTVTFTTASNAQLKQIQSGTAVDRSPTAAARYPDVSTIPVYLSDPARFWTFTVTVGAPDKASIHGAWVPTLGLRTLPGTRSTPGATTVSRPPTAGTGGSVYTPGAGNVTVTQPPPTGAGSAVFQPGAGSTTTTTQVGTLFDIRNVAVTTTLDDVTIRFDAAANSNPTVHITPASVGAAMKLNVASSPGSGGMMRYVATPATKLPRGSSYNYGILAAATGTARQNSTSGTFKTLSQRMRLHISEINVINDSDDDSKGELIFDFDPCTPSVSTFRIGSYVDPVDWGDGPQWVVIDLKPLGETPDQFRLLVGAEEDDAAPISARQQRAPSLNCQSPHRSPGKTGDWEWNSLILDVDLTKYPGPLVRQNFVLRSQPPSGTKLEFAITGYWEVTRK